MRRVCKCGRGKTVQPYHNSMRLPWICPRCRNRALKTTAYRLRLVMRRVRIQVRENIQCQTIKKRKV